MYDDHKNSNRNGNERKNLTKNKIRSEIQYANLQKVVQFMSLPKFATFNTFLLRQVYSLVYFSTTTFFPFSQLCFCLSDHFYFTFIFSFSRSFNRAHFSHVGIKSWITAFCSNSARWLMTNYPFSLLMKL